MKKLFLSGDTHNRLRAMISYSSEERNEERATERGKEREIQVKRSVLRMNWFSNEAYVDAPILSHARFLLEQAFAKIRSMDWWRWAGMRERAVLIIQFNSSSSSSSRLTLLRTFTIFSFPSSLEPMIKFIIFAVFVHYFAIAFCRCTGDWMWIQFQCDDINWHRIAHTRIA